MNLFPKFYTHVLSFFHRNSGSNSFFHNTDSSSLPNKIKKSSYSFMWLYAG